MNYVSKENMADILDGIARKIGQGGSGTGLEDWQAEKEYTYNDICVYEGQIYRAKVGFTSDATFNTTQILEEYTITGEETIIPYEKDTEISIDDIVSYDNNTYKALYNFVCGEEFSLYALEEYVPIELTDDDIKEIVDAYNPEVGAISIEYGDGTPIGRVVFDSILREGYIKANGAQIEDASIAIPRLLSFVQKYSSQLIASDQATYDANVGLYMYDSNNDILTLPNYIGRFMEGGNSVTSIEAGLPNIKGETSQQYSSSQYAGWHNNTGKDLGTGALYIKGSGTNYGQQSPWQSFDSHAMAFDASKSNPIYSDSITTVQPSSITLIPQIRY